MGSSRIVWSITAMLQPRKMLQTDKESLPDDESYDLVIGMLLLTDQIDATLKYIDLTLKSRKWIRTKPSVHPGTCATILQMLQWKRIVANEGLVVSAVGTTSRTNNAKLLDGSWVILKRALRQKKVPNPESYLAMIYAHASLGNLQKAFSTLHEFETTYRNSTKEAEEDLLSPFTSLCPLVMACSKDGFVTLDSHFSYYLLNLFQSDGKIYYQLGNLSQAYPPYKSVAALNCIILGCANTWDVDRPTRLLKQLMAHLG
ncbi:hypothetical protein TEA_018343 [Camellia sinensis var. sinensis]|uniref:Pentatricopeptide repeat-containing protein n=1 Tax=Camellia sinensis var. sinensis TaxID=542762 RepID=A0A4S4EMC3_CAMSN|nr:hypothetical protein TEA_018343 [Camellia sinensis var. sinensis]